MEEVTVKNYQELAMRTCLPSAKNWDYCYTLIVSEIGEAFGKWGKQFRDGAFESQLGRVADGVANRVDRLKSIGNGQVPLVAATTFRLLKGNGDER